MFCRVRTDHETPEIMIRSNFARCACGNQSMIRCCTRQIDQQRLFNQYICLLLQDDLWPPPRDPQEAAQVTDMVRYGKGTHRPHDNILWPAEETTLGEDESCAVQTATVPRFVLKHGFSQVPCCAHREHHTCVAVSASCVVMWTAASLV